MALKSEKWSWSANSHIFKTGYEYDSCRFGHVPSVKQLSARIQCGYYIASFSGLPDVGEAENLLALQDEESMHVGDHYPSLST